MKVALQSHSINSDSTHSQADIHNCIWENEINFSDSSDVFLLLTDSVTVAVSWFGLQFPLENLNYSIHTLLRKGLGSKCHLTLGTIKWWEHMKS